jgi:hypothetical protein
MPATNIKAFVSPSGKPQFISIKNNPPRSAPIISIEKEIISDKISNRSLP